MNLVQLAAQGRKAYLAGVKGKKAATARLGPEVSPVIVVGQDADGAKAEYAFSPVYDVALKDRNDRPKIPTGALIGVSVKGPGLGRPPYLPLAFLAFVRPEIMAPLNDACTNGVWPTMLDQKALLLQATASDPTYRSWYVGQGHTMDAPVTAPAPVVPLTTDDVAAILARLTPAQIAAALETTTAPATAPTTGKGKGK